jgi:hypothetical protein
MPDANPDLMTIFAESLERTDPAERADYLDHVCGDDIALRGRVEVLIAALDGAGRFLEPDPDGRSETTSHETEDATRTSALETRPPSQPQARQGTRTSVPETRPPSEPATWEKTPDGTIAAVPIAPPAAPPTGSSRARSSPAVTRCSKSWARGGWARSTGPSRPDRSSGRWP